MVKRIVLRMLALYLLFALIGRFVEEMGAARCGCAPGCWCQKPGLGLFRWVFPFGHRGDADEKRAAAEGFSPAGH